MKNWYTFWQAKLKNWHAFWYVGILASQVQKFIRLWQVGTFICTLVRKNEKLARFWQFSTCGRRPCWHTDLANSNKFYLDKSSCLGFFCEKAALKNIGNFPGAHPRRSWTFLKLYVSGQIFKNGTSIWMFTELFWKLSNQHMIQRSNSTRSVQHCRSSEKLKIDWIDITIYIMHL